MHLVDQRFNDYLIAESSLPGYDVDVQVEVVAIESKASMWTQLGGTGRQLGRAPSLGAPCPAIRMRSPELSQGRIFIP